MLTKENPLPDQRNRLGLKKWMLFQTFIISEQAHENPLKEEKDSKQEVNQKCKKRVKLHFDCDIILTYLCIFDELFMSTNALFCFSVYSKANA